jgi:hypothetical protein
VGTTIYPTVPVEGQGAQLKAEPWPGDEQTIRIDEMFARQLDNEFSAGVRGLLHDPETGIAAQSGESALEAIAGALPALNDLKERTLSQAIGPRQRSIMEPLIETRLDWAAGTLGQLAQRATAEVDDASVADRVAGLNQDAVAAWQDPAHLRKLGRTAVEELRYQGERRGWDPAETDMRVRTGLSDLYAGAVEAAISQDDLDGATSLYAHARVVIDPERQAALDRRFVRAREAAVYRDVDRGMAGIPIKPAGPPGAEVFAERAGELTPDDATDEVRAGIAQVAAFAQRRAERQWQKQQAEAGVAALDWFGKNPGRSFLAIPQDIRDWLAPDQWQGLEALFIDGRLRTDRDLFERLDWLLVYKSDAFAALDLDRHRLSLDDEDHARFAAAQEATAEGTMDPAFVRYRRARLDADRALEAKGIDTGGSDARVARANVRGRLGGFEVIEGRPPNGQDIDGIVNGEVSGLEVDDPNDPFNLFPQKPVDPNSSAIYRSGDQNTTDGLFLPVQAVGDNYRQGRAAELTVLEEIKKLLPEPRSATHIRLYVEGGPRYMVGDIVFSPYGTSLIVLEVKSGMAELTPMQIRALAEAVKSGNIHLTNPAAAKMFGLEVGQTFAEKKILPQVYVIDGNQEAIRRQMIRAGLEVIPEYLGRRRVLRLRARPT